MSRRAGATRWRTGAGFALALWLGFGRMASAAAPTVIDLNEPAPAGGPEDAALRHFSDAVAAGTHGEVIIHPHLNGALGNPQTSVEDMMFGDLNMFSSPLTNYLPLMIDEMSGLETPFLIPSVDATRKYLASPLLDEARAKVLDNRRVRYLEMTAIRRPFHVIASRRPLETIDDLAGLKLTTDRPMTKSAVRLWAALGVVYVPPMPAPRLKAALRSGQVDAVLLSDVDTVSRDGIEQAAPYLAGVDDCPRVWEISVNETLWRRLSPADQAVLHDAATESAGVFEKVADERFKRQLADLTARTHKPIVTLDADAARRRMLATYDALVAEGTLNPRVLKTANDIAAAPR